MTTTTHKPVTADQLWAMGDVGRCELVGGEIIHMAPAGAEHGEVAIEVAYRIKTHVDAKGLGKVYAAETGFVVAENPDTVRAADVAFVRKERLPGSPVRGFMRGAPDLAVEVVSPSDRLSEVTMKVNDWLAGGATSVWVIDPPNRSIDVYRSGNQVIRYRSTDELRDEPTLRGFILRVGDLFRA